MQWECIGCGGLYNNIWSNEKLISSFAFSFEVNELRLHPAMIDVQEEILRLFQKAAYELCSEILERQRIQDNV